ncbi:MAG: efflux RND transporter permease subunit [Alphaproteobacteria bacterium]|nr:efflux RND transporter permease subunit [Alphaproteobacteria bacterium]
MNLASYALNYRAVTIFFVILLVFGGMGSFTQLGQLEDPEFTIKTAVVATTYTGASAAEVELEVTDRIELAAQQLKQLDHLESVSIPGLSIVKVFIKPSFQSDTLPQIWDELKSKIKDVEPQLPPGAGRPFVNSDFGDVFGLVLAVTGDGYSFAELEQYVDDVKKELSLVAGVGKIEAWGVQDRVIYLDVSEAQLTELGLSDDSIEVSLQQQNMVVDAGSVDIQTQRLKIQPGGTFASPFDIADLVLTPSAIDSLQAVAGGARRGGASELIRIGDISTVREGYVDPPQRLMRVDGIPAVAIGLAVVPGGNVVTMGENVDARLSELLHNLPVGIEINRVHWQSDIVKESIDGFFVSLGQAVVIVLAVLAVSMGLRMGVIIGTGLVLTILGTFIFMKLFSIDLQRMSLGALVVALGMMVDNSIVVADGIAVRIKQRMEPTKAAIEAASQPAWPLLGATVIAVMAFYPIFASDEGAGEYCATLFSVVAIALMFSWFISMTVTPLQCVWMLKPPPAGAEDTEEKPSRILGAFRDILVGCLRARWLTIGASVALLIISFAGFGRVEQLFFPDSAMTKFMIDYWAPEGTRIEMVAEGIEPIEAKLLADDRVESVASFIGAGPPRFYLPVEPESPNSSYAQLIVEVHERSEIAALVEELTVWLEEAAPQALVPIRRFGVGPAETWKFEVRFTGQGIADADTLREIAVDAVTILEEEPLAGMVQTDWRQSVLTVVPEYSQERGRWAGVTRNDVARATKRAFDGRTVGLYREDDKLIPVVMRYTQERGIGIGGIDTLQVRPAMSTDRVPLSQVTKGIAQQWEESKIAHYDRKRTITVQSNPISGVTLPTLRTAVLSEFNALATNLPPGFSMAWGGEYENSAKAQASLLPGLVPAVVIMVLIIILLFNAFRPPVMIFLLIPFVVVGMTAGLLFTGTPFGFVALLGAMSPAGMMIKNIIVLLDEINLNLSLGKSPYPALVEATLSRVRPVSLAAATTVLGVVPLLQDVFWVGLAVTIMGGLTFGTVVTMVLFPVVYSIFYRVKPAAA